MLIYLDLNVIQDLKKDEGKLLSFIKNDQRRNVYCFSEAHLYDLSRDHTEEKFADMDLLSEVAGANCYSFSGEVLFKNETPREYFDRFDWTPYLNSVQDFPPEFEGLLEAYKLIPFNFSDAFFGVDLPTNMPSELRALLDTTFTYYDFFVSFFEFSIQLSNEQEKLKSLLQFLRSSDFLSKQYEHFKIEGFDGTEINDHQKFLDSYSKFCTKDLVQPDIYNAFIRIYYSLEFLSIVKGKVSKQKLQNLINDGRHAFFGSYCDIIVSTDKDFLKKCKFLCEAIGIYPWVISKEEFTEWVETGPREDDDFPNLFRNIYNLKELDLFKKETVHETDYSCFHLKKTYFDYFNCLTIGMKDDNYFFYFSREKNRFSKGTLINEFKIMVALLLEQLGEDLQKKGALDIKEFEEGVMVGRGWIYEGFVVEIFLKNGITLKFDRIEDRINLK